MSSPSSWFRSARDLLTRAIGPLECTTPLIPCPALPADLEGLRIAHFSDMHYHGWRPVHDQLRAGLLQLRPDLIVISGDTSHQPYQVTYTLQGLARLLAGIHPPLGIFATVGNHDSHRLACQGRSWAGVETPDRKNLPAVNWLDDQTATVTRGRATLALLGLCGTWFDSGRFDSLAAAALAAAPRAFRILIGHYPNCVALARSARVELVLSGHSHGGQMSLPGLGPITSNDWLPRRFGAGLHRFDQTWLYVTRGVGLSGPIRSRLFCRPELTLLTLAKGTPPPARLIL